MDYSALLTPYALSQLCAFCALCLGIAAYRSRCDNCLKINIGVSSTFMALHFALLGAWVGTGLCVISAVRYVSSRYTHNDWLFATLLAAGIIIGLFNFSQPADILPIIAGTLATLAVFKTRGRTMRYVLLGVSSSWLIFNLVHHSVMGMVLEGFYLATNLRNLYTCYLATTPTRCAVCNPYPAEEVG